MSFLSNEYFAGLGHSTPGWSEEERLKFPCPGRDSFVCLLPMAVMRCIMHARWLILLVLCPAGRHCEEGTYQDSWFLSNRRVHSKPCMQSSYISGVEHIRLCKSRPTPVRSTIHIKPSHVSACMLVTIVSKPVRGTIVRWLASLSEGWINAISLCCVPDGFLLNLLHSTSVASFTSTGWRGCVLFVVFLAKLHAKVDQHGRILFLLCLVHWNFY